MARKKRVYEDDDGRTIADMSGVTGPSLLRPRSPEQKPSRQEPEQQEQDRPWEDNQMSPRERRMVVLGAMKATMLIALAYIVGIGLLIALLLWLWN